MIGSWRTKKVPRNSTAEGETASKKTFSQRDLFLPRDIQEVQEDLPPTCKFKVPNTNELHKLELVVSPAKDSMWCGGKFKFIIDVPNDYKYSPPKVRCLTRIYHPNITETGDICLSILRLHFDETGWLPTRSLKDVVCGLNSLFTDLLNFEDPLNSSAAEHYMRDPKGFARQVKEYINKYAVN
ncbi:PREDICTED: NEDD8-conjugating enzyme UBE2F-like [Rhagoletis zephyria]|uniref:NEDD8-conjugating enzyme UBE2F-like n=1 Tax=Rhagoletis zephyria TaxID=28612 RepID=UPI0008113AA7|nr:PREDICTED: NEDD8-conjugating enzyme UBE2F-like [Rhagoletis zephyria]